MYMHTTQLAGWCWCSIVNECCCRTSPGSLAAHSPTCLPAPILGRCPPLVALVARRHHLGWMRIAHAWIWLYVSAAGKRGGTARPTPETKSHHFQPSWCSITGRMLGAKGRRVEGKREVSETNVEKRDDFWFRSLRKYTLREEGKKIMQLKGEPQTCYHFEHAIGGSRDCERRGGVHVCRY